MARYARRFVTGHLLFQDGRDQRVHDGARLRDMEAAVVSPQLRDNVVMRLEPGVVIEGADQPCSAVERPSAPGPHASALMS
jgi:hypothetical protein